MESFPLSSGHGVRRGPGSPQPLRRNHAHPWDWAPGFFAELGLGYGQDWGRATRFLPGSLENGYDPIALTVRQDRASFEAALGAGYRWHAGPLNIDCRFAFGPKWMVRKEPDEMGATRETGWMESLLRFQDLEVGFSL